MLLQEQGGETDTEVRVSTESWPRRRKFACRSYGTQTHDLWLWVCRSTTEPSPLPKLNGIDGLCCLQLVLFGVPELFCKHGTLRPMKNVNLFKTTDSGASARVLSRKVMMMNWCLMSSDVMRHIRDKLWPMPKHGAINLYVHGNQKAR